MKAQGKHDPELAHVRRRGARRGETQRIRIKQTKGPGKQNGWII